MMWQSTALILVAFVAAGLAVWFAPTLLGLLGLDEFGVIGQVCFAVLVLSVLDIVFDRLPGSGPDNHRPAP